MELNDAKLKVLWMACDNANLAVNNLDVFKSKMMTPEKRKVFFDYIKNTCCKSSDVTLQKACGVIKQNTYEEFESWITTSYFDQYSQEGQNANQSQPSTQTANQIDVRNVPNKILQFNKYEVPMPQNIQDCDENAFNWSVGCKNNKIAEINQKLFKNPLNGVYTEDLKKFLISHAYFKDQNNPIITKDVYDDIMKTYLNETSVKKVVNKVLKEAYKQKR